MVPLIKAIIVTDDEAHKRWGEDDVFPVLIATKQPNSETKQLNSGYTITIMSRKYYRSKNQRYAKERIRLQ